MSDGAREHIVLYPVVLDNPGKECKKVNHDNKKVHAELSNRVQWVLAHNYGSFHLSLNTLSFLAMSFSVKMLLGAWPDTGRCFLCYEAAVAVVRCTGGSGMVRKHSPAALCSLTALWDEIELCIEDLKFFPRNLTDSWEWRQWVISWERILFLYPPYRVLP